MSTNTEMDTISEESSDDTQPMINKNSVTSSFQIREKNIITTKLKLQYIILFRLWILLLVNILIFGIIYNYNINDKVCTYPDYNTHNRTFGYCVIYDNCIIMNISGQEILTARDRFYLPTTYKLDPAGVSCPLYLEVPGFHTTLHNDCDDQGYGCCKEPIHSACAIRMHFKYRETNKYNVFLYKRNLNDHKTNPQYLNIAKEDINGTNCPRYSELLYETCWNRYTPILGIIGIVELLLTVFISCKYINKDEFYEKEIIGKQIDLY